MSHCTRIRIYRSEKWIAQQRLEKGENIAEYIFVDTDPAILSEESRAILLATGEGKYPEHAHHIPFSEVTYGVAYHGSGAINFAVDSVSPTTTEIDVAIVSAMAELDAKREKHLEGKAERDAEEAKRKTEHEIKQMKHRIEYLEGEVARLSEKNEKLRQEQEAIAKRIRKILKG